MHRHILTILLACLLTAATLGAAQAKPEACLTSVNGERRTLIFDPEEPNVKANTTFRERTFGGPKGIECPGFVTLTALLRDINPNILYADQEPFCLQYDPLLKTYLGVAEGPRDARLLCRKRSRSLCRYVQEGADAAMKVAGLGAAVSTGKDRDARQAGVKARSKRDSLIVIDGPAEYLSRIFGTLGARALQAVTEPGRMTATAVTVVVVGGALYACSE